jgi:hypothetical protein
MRRISVIKLNFDCKNIRSIKLKRNTLSSGTDTKDTIRPPPNDFKDHRTGIDKSKSFALAGCGWLTPFYFGMIEKMIEAGYMSESSVIAGTSGGSLGALVAVSGMQPRVGLKLMTEMSLDKTFRNNIDVGLKTFLLSVLPDDIVKRSNGKLHVCVSKMWPNPTGSPDIISNFTSKKDVVDTVAASCFIPLYSAPGSFLTKIANRPEENFIDGGVFGYMPPIGDIRVSPFTSSMLRRPPSIWLKESAFSMPRLLSWVLTPAPPDVLDQLYLEGYKAAEEWIALEEEKIAAGSSKTR